MNDITLPKDFLFGVATSACQVEGAALQDGKGRSIWDALAAQQGKILDGSTPTVSCDQYHHLKEDIAILRNLGVDSYRFSFSWPRILPAGIGWINQKGLDYYKRLVDELLKNGIMPNATLYHWDLPEALDQRGGWLNRDAVHWFGDYASLLFQEFGDRIPMWATVNEPIATYVGYSGGPFAPARGDEATGRQANHHILMAHGEAVQRFRRENLCNGKIGVVVDIWHHHPLRSDHAEDIAIAELENEKGYRSYLNPLFRGEYTDALLQYMQKQHCMPDIRDGDLKLIHQKLDFFGMNIYNRVVDCADPDLLKAHKKITGGNFMDNGEEYYPKAVYDAAHILHDEYKLDIPIYITENGTQNCCEEVVRGKVHDQPRIEYIGGFLKWIERAIRDGIDIRGYYAWSLLDNWEWIAGYSLRFGLVHVDYETQKRILKDSAIWYKKIIAKCKEQKGR